MEIKVIQGKQNYTYYKKLSGIAKQTQSAIRYAFRQYGNVLYNTAKKRYKR